jgi:hypothetical protein
MKNEFLAEGKGLKQAFAPVDLNTAPVAGARIGLKDGDRLAIVINLGTSTAAELRVSLQQHNAASAGVSKDLEIQNPYFHKAGAATKFTKVDPTAPAATFDLDSVFNADGGVVVFEVLAEDLDVNGDFSHVSVNIADSAAAKLGAAVYVLEPSYKPAYVTDL